MELILIRHGQTKANHERRLVGRSLDLPLTELGVMQINHLGKHLQDTQVNILRTSPTQRTLQTMEIIQRYVYVQNGPHVAKEIIERDYGSFEGLLRNELISKRQTLGIDSNDPTNYFPDGIENVETRYSVFKRVETLIQQDFNALPSNSTIMYITHGGLIYSLLTEKLGIPETMVRPIIIREGGYVRCSINRYFYEINELWNNPIIDKGAYHAKS